MIQVLVVGQTTSPYVGQFIMIEHMLKGEYKNIQLHHVRMSFSNSVDQIGRFDLGKVGRLFALIGRIWHVRFKYKATILYYPPAGPNKVPIIRDVIVLLFTRWLFSKIIFHFHAGGLAGFYSAQPYLVRRILELAYTNIDACIYQTPTSLPDGMFLNVKQTFIVPNGITDVYIGRIKDEFKSEVPTLLFVSMLRESKGLFVVLAACMQLKNQNMDFVLNIVGDFDSQETEARAVDYVAKNQLQNNINFCGKLTGDAKWDQFARADIFCFPSFYEAETFGLVAIEAMQFELPVIATNWRGLGTIIVDGETGFLVPVRDSKAVADKLSYLIQNPEEARRMGKNGRKRYLNHYTSEKFWENIEKVFVEIAQ